MNLELLDLYLEWIRFDPEQYLSINPDLRGGDVDPQQHFLHHGRFERRAIRDVGPNEIGEATDFDRDFYLLRNPDVKGAGIDPLVHFARHGIGEGRVWSPKYDYKGDAVFWAELRAVCGSEPAHTAELADKYEFLRQRSKAELRTALRSTLRKHRVYLFRRQLGRVLGYAALLADVPLLAEAFYQSYMNALPYLRVEAEGAKWCNVYPVRAVRDHSDLEAVCEILPGVTTELPEIEFLGKAPPKVPAGSVPLPPVYRVKLRDATFIANTSIVITSDKVLLYDDAYEMCSDPERDIRNPLTLAAANGHAAILVHNRERVVDQGAVLFNDHSHNYFHWLLELAPKLKFLSEMGVTTLLAEQHLPSQIKAIIRHMHPAASVLEFKPYETVRVKEAVVVSDFSRIVVRTRAAPRVDDYVLSPEAIEIVRKTFASLVARQKSTLRIYVRRLNPDFRRVLNAGLLQSFLASQGFRTLNPADMSIERQVGSFSAASLIVGEAGAGMANIIFASPKSEIVILTNGNAATNYYFFAQLASVVGARLRYYIGWENRNSHEVPVQNDYVVDVDELAGLLDELIAGRASSRPFDAAAASGE